MCDVYNEMQLASEIVRGIFLLGQPLLLCGCLVPILISELFLPSVSDSVKRKALHFNIGL